MHRLKLFLLGPPRVELNRSVLRFARRKVLALLAYLAVTGRSHSRDALAELLYPGHDRTRARADLRQTLSHLRGALGERWLRADRGAVALPSGRELWVDVHAYRQLIEQAGKPGAQTLLLESACGSYRGEFLAGFYLRDSPAFEDWQFFQAEDLRQEQSALLERLIAHLELAGEPRRALGYCRCWLELDPLEEAVHRRLMSLYALCGQRAAALRQYGRCRALLQKELGETPEAETEALHDEIRHHARPSARQPNRGVLVSPRRDGAPRLPRANSIPSEHRLPADRLRPEALVGREAEMAAIRKLLMAPEVRILTLTGPGGTGKTRLAIQAAAVLSPGFADGTFFVDLAEIRDADEVAPALAAALKLREPVGQACSLVDVLRTFLSGRRSLLLLDNFEHVREAAPQIAEIAANARACKVLVTSRESLHIPGGREFPVPPLSLPDVDDGHTAHRVASSEAARLFALRAAAVRPGFALTEENAATVVEICRQLDGLPLAIELAASRLRILSLTDLLSRLSDRLRLLRDESGNLPVRQRTLRATLDWSYDLLDAGEKRLFVGLSVFGSGFTVDAVERAFEETAPQAGSDTLEQLASLVEKSLLVREEIGGHTRLRMLETVREYCRRHFEESSDAEGLPERHACFFLELAETAQVQLCGPGQMAWLERLESEYRNLQAALAWFLGRNRTEEALRFAVALHWFWYRYGHFSDGRKQLQLVLEAAPTAAAPTAAVWRERALHALGWLEFVLGNWSRAHALYEEGLELSRRLNDHEGECLHLSNLGVAERWLGHREAGTAMVEQAVALARGLRDPAILGRALIWAYGTTGGRFEGQPPQAELAEAVELCRRTGDLWGISCALNGLGDLYRELGDWQRARPPYEEALAGFRELKDRWMMAWTLEGLGQAAQLAHEHRKAERCFRQALELFDLLGDRGNTTFMLSRLALAARDQGRHNRAACLLGACENTQTALFGPEAAQRLQQTTQLEIAATEYKLTHAASWVRGQTMGLEQAIGFVRAGTRSRQTGRGRARRPRPI